jgi:uncharacterized protein YqjF (DUF2071 family)
MSELLDAARRQAAVTDETAHRPWPLPERSWVLGQTWDDLLFVHWAVDPRQVRPHVPDGLELDLRDGSAWIGVTPFRLGGLRAKGTLPLPYVSSFLEINVRTYVTHDGKPGIWFFSLDASSEAAVLAARQLYRLPYFRARIRMEPGSRATFECTRDAQTEFSAAYGGAGPVSPAAPGSLEHFLTERYCLYAEHDGRLFRAEIHHRPWPLQSAEAEIPRNAMAPPGIEVDGEPLLHYSARQDVVIWALESAAQG